MAQAIVCLADSSGNSKGTVVFEQHRKGAIVFFNLVGFSPNSVHAIHIHEFGDLSRGCDSLGGHYNPTRENHGYHVGDLIKNFQTDSKGSFKFAYMDRLDVFDIFGRSVVVHALPDDLGGVRYDNLSTGDLIVLSKERGYKLGSRQAMIAELNKQSNTTGNAGRRIACGVIGRKN